MNRRRILVFFVLALVLPTVGAGYCQAQTAPAATSPRQVTVQDIQQRQAARLTVEQRLALAARMASEQQVSPSSVTPRAVPGGTPNYFGPEPNWLNSPSIRKFVDLLPGLGAANANDLGQYIPVAVPDTTTYSGCDYYEIQLRQYTEQLHADLPPTTLRGYVQYKNGAAVAPPSYLGPIIIAQKGRPVRVKFTNMLPTGAGGNLFLPVDTTLMGAGMGPTMVNGVPQNYTQNRAIIHLHGGVTPWVSDGTPWQWITPAGESTVYPNGVSHQNVPDMPAPAQGSVTLFYSNQQSARLMFYHDHAAGITRLNVYAGEVAPYILRDPTEQNQISYGIIPSAEIPLVIQDKTFVPDPATVTAKDPTWDTAHWGGKGNLWFPHVYMPNQNPNDISGFSPIGRWDYGPWVPLGPAWPVINQPITLGNGTQIPNVPNVSCVPESFLDTPLVNGTAYPICRVQPKAYRFRVLNGCNDRMLNLGIYYAKSNSPDSVSGVTGLPTLQTNSGEISTVAAVAGAATFPAYWGTPDDRVGGLPDPTTAGPPLIQIGNEGGFLPAPVVIPSTPLFYDLDTRSVTYHNVKEHGLFLGPAERADVIVDFSQVPVGSRLILYNDSPAPVPMTDYRDDYFTGNPDYSSIGGNVSTVAGYGPNTRTVMQFEVTAGTPAAAFNLTTLQNSFASSSTRMGIFAQSQNPILVPQAPYDSAYNASFPADKTAYATATSTSLTFTPMGAASPLTINFGLKSIDEQFENYYGRMNALLGTQLTFTSILNPNTIPADYFDVPTEFLANNITPSVPKLGDATQIWRVVHNGVDTHAIHVHLFNVQVLGRVDAVGIVKPPEPNELGWKETIRMNPLEDCIVALQPVAPRLPFGVPDGIRPLDPTTPLGSTGQFAQASNGVGPGTTPSTQKNVMYNFGWEYVWHCHLLGHEENDMMRPMVFSVARSLPYVSALKASVVNGQVVLTWTDGTPAATSWGNPHNEVGYHVQRAPGTTTTYTTLGNKSANSTIYTDATVVHGTKYTFRVASYNAAGTVYTNTVTITP